jgi:hypothetical protein
VPHDLDSIADAAVAAALAHDPAAYAVLTADLTAEDPRR